MSGSATRGGTPGPAASLRALDARAYKALGQHFLASESVASSIVRIAGVGEGSRVLEIGPGLGALTRPLVSRGAEVVAVERDPTLAAWIGQTFPSVRVTPGSAGAVTGSRRGPAAHAPSRIAPTSMTAARRRARSPARGGRGTLIFPKGRI